MAGVTDANHTDPAVRAVRQFNQQLASHPDIETILLPIMRNKVDGSPSRADGENHRGQRPRGIIKQFRGRPMFIALIPKHR